MATTSNTYTGDGSTTNYSFTFEYLEQSEVKVTLDGAPTNAFTFANATTLSFTSAPANGVIIYVYRDTNVDTLKATFFPGSAIKAEDLNDNFTQNNFAVQEIQANTWDKEAETIHSDETWVANDTQISTTAVQEKQFATFVQTATPTGSNHTIGKTWLQTDIDKTLSIWDGSTWLAVASGGAFINQPKVVYVDASNGDDTADGHRISTPKQTIKAAIQQINADATYGDGSIVVVAPGVYQEACPIDIEKANVSIVGSALRSCIVHPTVATEENVMFRVNSGSYLQNLTFTGMKASGSLGNTVDATLPVNQGWNVAFYPGAVIKKSPYIQNCTNFSDSEIDNSNINVITPAGGLAGDTDSAPTGGGLLIDGSVVNSTSPLRSMVCDSYTHVGLNGPGILVTNNGYAQCTSSYAFFNKYHIKCLNGGQANLAASTTDFGDEALVADGKSSAAIFTATTTASAASGDITFTIGAPVVGTWHGTATRPQSNMLATVNGITYPVLSAVANGAGWDVTISRPNPSKRSENLGLNGTVISSSPVEFFLRSMIASSGHTMEYVGSGTDYRALPENGGIPDDSKQIVESNDGKVWTAITDHNGKFKIGDFFEVDQRTGFINFNAGSYAFDVITDTTPELGGELNALNNKIVNLGTPTAAQDAATKAYVDSVAYGNSDVDNHINVSGASSGQILSWNGSDYAWVTDQTGSGGGLQSSDIGVTVQGYDDGLEYLNGLNFTNEATFKAGVNLEIGVDVQAYDADTTKNDVANTFTAEQTFNAGVSVDGAYEQAAEAVAALDIDLSTGNYFTKTINANSTFTFSNPPASGTVGSFTLELTHTSGTVTWPASVKFNADTAPTLTTGKTHLFFFVTDDGGTRYRGAALVDYVN